MSAKLILPLNFGQRPCDRDLADILAPKANEAEVLAWSLLVWKDFAIARDDRRSIQLAEGLEKARTVRTIERFIRWPHGPGGFVIAAIEAGFFSLVRHDTEQAELVLADFFPANRIGAIEVSGSRIGGARKSVRHAKRQAESSVVEQLDFLKRSEHPVLAARSSGDVRAAMLFVHQFCNVLKKPFPQSQEWHAELVGKAVRILTAYDDPQIEKVMTWLVMHRDDQEMQSRTDFLLDAFDSFVERSSKEIR